VNIEHGAFDMNINVNKKLNNLNIKEKCLVELEPISKVIFIIQKRFLAKRIEYILEWNLEYLSV